jgi:hypothetical protein
MNACIFDRRFGKNAKNARNSRYECSIDQEKSKMPKMLEMHVVLTVDLAKMPEMPKVHVV